MESRFATVISADSHVMEPRDLWFKTIGNRFGDRTPRVLHEYLGRKGTFFYTGRQVLKVTETDLEAQKIGYQAAGYLPEVRVKFQKEAGVQAEVLNATLMLLILQGKYHHVVRAAARVFNDWITDFAAYDRTRLLPVGIIPMDDVDWAMAELERNIKNGHKGAIIHLLPPEGCPPYRDTVWDRFWSVAEEAAFVLTLHIITGRVPDPLHFHLPEEQEESPRTQLALMYEVMGPLANEFIFGRILDRFPRLKLVCSEFEISWLPNFMWRLDQMQEAFGARLQLPKLEKKASAYVRENMWHGVIDDPFAIATIAHVGADRIMWGSDFPHVRSIGLDARSRLTEMFGTLPTADTEKLVAANAAQVFGL
jgi:predicted TIM-barrel fold metal-dependent hydrolase